MNILITGATGYIGSKLAKKLLKEDKTLTLYLLTHKRSLSDDELLSDRVVLVNSEDMYKHKYDFIYHIGALKNTKSLDTEYLKDLIDSNLKLSIDLLLFARDTKTPIVLISSFSQYVDKDPYCFTKSSVEEFARLINFDKYTFVRFTDIYGEDDPRPKIFNLFQKAVDNKESFVFQSPASKPMNFTHIDDITDALIYLMSMEDRPQIVDLIYKENLTTLGEMAKQIDPNLEYAIFPTAESKEEYLVPTDSYRLKGFRPRYKVRFDKRGR